MKKLYILTLVAALALPSFAAPRKAVFKEKVAKEAKARAAGLKKQSEAHHWLPLKDYTYTWDDEDWFEDDSNEYTYDEQGNVLTQLTTDFEGNRTLTQKTYDEKGRVIKTIIQSAEADDEFINSQLTEIKYDDIVPNLVIENLGYNWNQGEWAQTGNNYKRTITRDAAGKITGIEVSVLLNGEFDPTLRLSVEYGADGKANKITETALDYDWATESYAWIVQSVVKDIVWDRTDGQITSADELLTGANRIKSATIEVEGETQTIEVTYVPDSESYTMVMRTQIEDYGIVADLTKTQIVTILDQYGSYDLTDIERYEYDEPAFDPEEEEPMAIEDEGDTERVVEEYTVVEKFRINELDLVLLSYAADESEGYEPEIYEWIKGAVTIDEEKGYITEYIQEMYDPDLEEFVNSMRVVFDNYTDLAGATLVEADKNAPAEYYNLQGVRVENPAAGLYIERRGATVRKVLVK